MSSVREVRRAKTWSWVTITMVLPCSTSSANIPITCSAVREVEVAGRLIGDQDGRVVSQGPGHGGALLLAASDSTRQLVSQPLQPHPLQEIEGARFTAGGE